MVTLSIHGKERSNFATNYVNYTLEGKPDVTKAPVAPQADQT